MKHLWLINAAFAAFMGVLAGLMFTTSAWPFGFFDVAAFGINVGCGILNYKRPRRVNGSNRSTEASHSYTEAGGGAEHMGAIQSTGANTPATSASELESVYQTDLIRAWRGVQVVAAGHTVHLGAINAAFGSFTADEHKATCHKMYDPYRDMMAYTRSIIGQMTVPSPPVPHNAPGVNCECGFYGVKDKKHALGRFIAEADFYGTVIEHELGYRAEYQRILSVRVVRPSYCEATFLCEGTPELIVFPEQGEPIIACEACGTQVAIKNQRVANLHQLATRLGVEFRWDEMSALQKSSSNG